MLNLKWRFGNAGISGTWDCDLPVGYAKLFREMCQAYYYSATKKSKVFMQGMSDPINSLVADYYNYNNVQVSTWESSKLKEIEKGEYKTDSKKVTIMFTGGKDSLHALLHYMEKLDKSKIQCIYIPNINRSETLYERKTVEQIAKKCGVSFQIVEIKNSVRINRSNHNIALRDQLILTLALPYIVQFRSSTVCFGLHNAFRHLADSSLFTSHISAFKFLTTRMESSGINLKIVEHPRSPITEIEITKELIEKHNEFFWMTNSCYRQLNFRERQNASCQKRHPDFKIYNGCGNCLKCLRIHGILCLYESSGHKAARWNMAKEVNNVFLEKYSSDHTLLEILKELRGDILKTK